MYDSAKRNFILQQGFAEPAPEFWSSGYFGLRFQPRIVLLWVIAGIVLQSPAVFAALAAVQWWSALFPVLNPFDAVYNGTFGRRAGAFRLTPAPPPRRTALVIAGSFAVACAVLLSLGLMPAAYAVEGVFLFAILAVAIGGFCVGAFVHHLFRGRVAFACETLPWAHG